MTPLSISLSISASFALFVEARASAEVEGANDERARLCAAVAMSVRDRVGEAGVATGELTIGEEKVMRAIWRVLWLTENRTKEGRAVSSSVQDLDDPPLFGSGPRPHQSGRIRTVESLLRNHLSLL